MEMVPDDILIAACKAALTSRNYPNGNHPDLYDALLSYYHNDHKNIVLVKNSNGGGRVGARHFRKDHEKKD